MQPQYRVVIFLLLGAFILPHATAADNFVGKNLMCYTCNEENTGCMSEDLEILKDFAKPCPLNPSQCTVITIRKYVGDTKDLTPDYKDFKHVFLRGCNSNQTNSDEPGYGLTNWEENQGGSTGKGCTTDLCNKYVPEGVAATNFAAFTIEKARYEKSEKSAKDAEKSLTAAKEAAAAAQKAYEEAAKLAKDNGSIKDTDLANLKAAVDEAKKAADDAKAQVASVKDHSQKAKDATKTPADPDQAKAEADKAAAATKAADKAKVTAVKALEKAKKIVADSTAGTEDTAGAVSIKFQSVIFAALLLLLIAIDHYIM